MTHLKLAVLSTRVDAMDWQRSVNKLQSLRSKKDGSYIAFCNVHMAVTARTDDELAVALEEADIVLPDGAPIAWTLRRLGAPAMPARLERRDDARQLVTRFDVEHVQAVLRHARGCP